MKEGWKYMKLGEIATIRRGLTYKKEDEVEKSNKIVLRSNNVDLETHQLIFDELKYLKDDFDIPEEKILKKGDLLMCMSNGSKIHLGKVALIEQNTHFAFGGFMSAIEHNKSVLDKFFYYALISPNFKQHIKELQDGANINNLKIRDIESFSIPVPPLPDQQRIVSYLDAEFVKIDALKANAEKQLQAAKDLFQAALKELLTPKEGWKIVNIGDVFKSYSGGTPSKSHQEYYTNATIPWLNSGEVCQKYITSTTNFISELGLKNSSAKYFPINTVLIAMYGATAAQAGILKFKATSNQAVCGLLPTKEMIPEFVYYWFLHNKTEFASMAQGGAQPNLSQIKIKAMPIPIIEVEQQQSISDKLNYFEEKVKQLQTNYTETITLCNDLKQALLKKVFEEDG